MVASHSYIDNELDVVCQRIIANMKENHLGKWVNPLCAIGTKVSVKDGLTALKHLVTERIVEKDELCGMQLYRYAPLPTFLETVE